MNEFFEYFTKQIDIYLTECGKEQYQGYFKCEYNVRRDIVFHYVDSGIGFYEVKGKRYKLQAGDMFILRKHEKVKYYSDPENPWKYYWIALKGEKLDNILSKTKLSNSDVCHFDDKSESIQIIKDFVAFNQTNPDSHLKFLWNQRQLFHFLYHISIEFINETEISSSSLTHNQLADIIIDYIYDNYTENITVQGIADHFNISRSYLYKICMKRFNKTPKEIILRKRLNHSAKMLLHTDLLIKEISSHVGFTNQLYFSKIFKENFGYSPSEFRKSKNIPFYYLD